MYQSDKTRATDYEAHIQARVQAELQKVEAETEKAIKDIEERIGTSALENPDKPPAPGKEAQRILPCAPKSTHTFFLPALHPDHGTFLMSGP